ncbi:MAG: VCBS repeat-containing protein [Acidobacteria bacterium]|nr:VCBS repeat-containing protein [Acidobacteriota bacterium]
MITTLLWSGANTASAQAQRGILYDFTGSGRTSFVTLRSPATTGGPITWAIAANPQNPTPGQALIREFVFGNDQLDFVVPEDYTGTTRAEPTVWRDSNGVFFVAQTPVGTGGVTVERAVQWGAPDDNPRAIGDYDGDGKTDYTVVRTVGTNFIWYIMSSSTGAMRAIPFGSSVGLPTDGTGFTFFPGADFTGDGRDELIFATTDEDQTRVTYFIGDAVTGAGVLTRNFGVFASDISLPPDDYTGDGRADFVAVRQTGGNTLPATWFILNVATNTFTSTPFGIADRGFAINDRPVRGDYDGDRIHDIAVFRQSNQTFYWINSSSPGTIGSQRMPASANGRPLADLDNY